MVAAFIRERGVTKCPGMGTKELAAFNARRELEQKAAGGYHWRAVRRGRKRRAA